MKEGDSISRTGGVYKWCVVALCVAPFAAERLAAGDLPGLPKAELSFKIVAEEFGSSNRATRVASPSNMNAADVRSVGGKTVMSWRGCESFGDDFEVTATLAPQPDGSLAWTFSYANCECLLQIAEVRFPILVVPRKPNTAILYQASVGALTFQEWNKVRPGDCVASARPQTFHFIASLTEGGMGWYVDQRGEARFYTGKFEAKVGPKQDAVNVVVAGNAALAMKRDCATLNGASAEKMLPATRGLSRYGGAEVAWSFAFPASAAMIGVNDVAFKPGGGNRRRDLG